MRRVRAYVGLGANIGDASETLATGVRTLAVLPGVRLHAVSRLYVTRPVGVEDQPPFRNAVVALDVPAGPDRQTGAIALLVALKGLERAFGRQERERWGPRELDLDLLLFGRARLAIVPSLFQFAMRGDEESLLEESGADDYVSKPILDLEAFASKIQRWLGEAAA